MKKVIFIEIFQQNFFDSCGNFSIPIQPKVGRYREDDYQEDAPHFTTVYVKGLMKMTVTFYWPILLERQPRISCLVLPKIAIFEVFRKF